MCTILYLNWLFTIIFVFISYERQLIQIVSFILNYVIVISRFSSKSIMPCKANTGLLPSWGCSDTQHKRGDPRTTIKLWWKFKWILPSWCLTCWKRIDTYLRVYVTSTYALHSAIALTTFALLIIIEIFILISASLQFPCMVSFLCKISHVIFLVDSSILYSPFLRSDTSLVCLYSLCLQHYDDLYFFQRLIRFFQFLAIFLIFQFLYLIDQLVDSYAYFTNRKFSP